MRGYLRLARRALTLGALIAVITSARSLGSLGSTALAQGERFALRGFGIGRSQFDELDAHSRSVSGGTEEEITSDASHTSATATTALWVATGILGGIAAASFVIERLVTVNPPRPPAS